MKAFIRKIRTVKKRKLLKDCLCTFAAGMSLRYGQMSHKTKPSPFFVNSNQSNQQVERPHRYQQVMIMDDENQSSIDNPSVHRVKLGSGITLISRKVNKKQDQISEPLKSTITQKSELTYSQDEIDALGLGEINKEVSLVVGLPMPHSSQSTLAVHEKNWNQLIQESNIPINMEQLPKIVMSRTSADLTNQKWIKEFICALRAGSDEELTASDEELIKSILGKVSESELDVPSINKILKSIANATLSVASNQKLMRILVELQKPIPKSPLTVTPSTKVVKVPAKLEEYQQKSKSSSSLLAEAWMPELPRHRSADSTRCYGQRQNQQNTRTLSVHDGSQADISERSVDHSLSKHGHNFGIDDKLPPNLNQKPTKYEQPRTRVNDENRQKLLDEAQIILNDKQFSQPFENIRIRGIKSRGYVYKNPDYPGIAENEEIAGLFIGIHEEGPFQGEIKKMQPITQLQLDILQEQRRID